MLSPKVKTAIAVGIPVALTIAHFVAPHFSTADVIAVLGGLVAVSQGIVGVLNVFHVSSGVKTVLSDVVEAAVEAKADIPADTLAQAKRISGGAS